MTQVLQQHEYAEGAETCRHCGATKNATGVSCRPRITSDGAAPRARTTCMGDIDGIHRRILELRAEQDAAMKRESAA